jgi:hypothetical protein
MDAGIPYFSQHLHHDVLVPLLNREGRGRKVKAKIEKGKGERGEDQEEALLAMRKEPEGLRMPDSGSGAHKEMKRFQFFFSKFRNVHSETQTLAYFFSSSAFFRSL